MLSTGLGTVVVGDPLEAPAGWEVVSEVAVALSPPHEQVPDAPDGGDEDERDERDDARGPQSPAGRDPALGHALARLQLGDALQGGLNGRVAGAGETFLKRDGCARPCRTATTTRATTPKRARMAAEGTTRSSHSIGAGRVAGGSADRNSGRRQAPGVTR